MASLRPYFVPPAQRRRLAQRARAAQRRSLGEICGLVLSDAERRIEFVFMKNLSDMPCCYALAKPDFKTVRAAARQAGQHILGSFHSHPAGDSRPSEHDLNGAFYQGVELIYDVVGDELKLWRYNRSAGKLTEMPLRA